MTAHSSSDALADFLEGREPLVQRTVNWGEMPLQVSAHITPDMPPAHVTSVRAVVIGTDGVLVLQNGEERHVLPGGRCESGESVEETLRREVLEETGYEIEDLHLVGFLHFRHLGPMPEGYGYSYPDFLQVVFAARAGRYVPDRAIHDPYVTGAEMVPFQDLDALPIPEEERVFLRAALGGG